MLFSTFDTSPFDGLTNPGLPPFARFPRDYFFRNWKLVHFDSEPRPNGQDRTEIWVSSRCGASGEMKSSTRASRSQKRKAQDAGIESSKADSPAPGSAEAVAIAGAPGEASQPQMSGREGPLEC